MIQKKISILQKAFVVSVANTCSSLFSLVAQLILASRFGTGIAMDAYFAAITIPQVLLRLAATPLHSVFVPIYTDLRRHRKKKADNIAAGIILQFVGLFAFFAIIQFSFSDVIARLVLQGASSNTVSIAAQILQLLSVYVFISGIFYVTQAIHIAYNSFSIPSIANCLSSLVTIIVTFITIQTFGIWGAAYGLILGAFVQLMMSVYFLPSHIFVKPIFETRYTKQFYALFLPIGLGSLIFKATPIIERYFASFLAQGDISVLGYAYRILDNSTTLLASGLTVVVFPMTAAFATKAARKHQDNYFSWGVRAVLMLIVPVIAYLSFFSNDLIKVLFERGAFTEETTKQVSDVLIAYSGALLSLSLGGQLTNILYSHKRHLLVSVINITLMPVYFIGLKMFLSHGPAGIASAYTIFTWINVLTYFFLVRHYINYAWQEWLMTAAHTLFAAGLMIGTLFLLADTSFFTDIMTLRLFVHIFLGFLVYTLVLLIIGNKDARVLFNYAKNIFKK